MKQKFRIYRITAVLLSASLFLSSCVTFRYIRDEESSSLQKKIQGRRTTNIVGDAFFSVGSAVMAFFTGIYVGYTLGKQSLKSLKLINTGTDTLQVNLLSDFFWKDSVYCDIRDIRIPPGEKCRLLVPSSAIYNLYFSNTINSEEDDEIIEVNPIEKSRIFLTPGMTISIPDSTQLKNR